MQKKELKIVFFGPPTSGKGTQAKILAKKLELTHFSTGSFFRQEAAKGTKIGQKVAKILDKGKLVSDKITNKVVADKLEEFEGGFILDGYPRSLKQAEALAEIIEVSHAFFINISDEEVIERVSNRRVCVDCGKIYNLAYESLDDETKCSNCGGRLIQRRDDKEDVVEKRLKQYHKVTKPIVEFYKNKGSLFEIDGEKPIDEVTQNILDHIKLD